MAAPPRASEAVTFIPLEEKVPPSYEVSCGTAGNQGFDMPGAVSEESGQDFVYNGAIPVNTGSRPKNVILFGQTGVGKSSIINLLAGRDVARISSGLNGCTLEATKYSFSFPGSMEISIFDTAGLEESEMGVNTFFGAVTKANMLIKSLHETGGVDLLVFCIHGGRVTDTMQQNYRLFSDILCGGQVPVAIVVTNLEHEEVMENWWTRNEATLNSHKIRSVGHACITALPTRVQRYAQKRAESRKALRMMLIEALKNANSPYVQGKRGWFGTVVGHLASTSRLPWTSLKKDVSRRLQRECGFTRSDADALAQMLATSSST